MNEKDAQLLAVLRIARDMSRRSAGLSLREALARTRYAELRPRFGPADLLPLIEADATLADEWISYSMDKRTSGGWYITEQGEIGRLDAPQATIRFDSVEEAVAEYVVRELDDWAGLAGAR